MKAFKVNGYTYSSNALTMKPKELHVMISNDKLGITLSINDNKSQFTIPITKEMLKELTK